MITENLKMDCPQRDSTECEEYAEALSIYLPEDLEREHKLSTEHLMEEIVSIPNMKEAMKRVRKNGGAAGVDGMEIPEAMDWLKTHFAEVQEELMGGYYHPSAVRRRVIPKPEGGERKLGIPTVKDRVVQQAIAQILVPLYEPQFAENSFGYRPGRSGQQAILKVKEYAEEGYAVATIRHRSTENGCPFPAFLIDAKCAIRFLRANAAKYALNTEKIVAFGTSSGGNTVCLLGLTGDDPEFRTPEYREYSDAVQSVISCFAPTDLPALFEHLSDFPDREAVLTAYFGPDKARWQEEMIRYSPVFRVKDGPLPPFLLLHGTGDPLVPCSQLDALYARLQEVNAQVRACYVTGAEHEGNFWGPQVRTLIHEEIVSRLK